MSKKDPLTRLSPILDSVERFSSGPLFPLPKGAQSIGLCKEGGGFKSRCEEDYEHLQEAEDGEGSDIYLAASVVLFDTRYACDDMPDSIVSLTVCWAHGTF